MTYYREDLSALARDRGDGCITFPAPCHPGAPPWILAREGLLTLECSECGRRFATFVVASRPPRASDEAQEALEPPCP